MNLDAALARMGIEGVPASMLTAKDASNTPKPLTKKEKEAIAAKEKEEKLRRKAAKMVMMASEGGSKATSAKPAKKKAEGTAAAESASSDAPAASTPAAALAPTAAASAYAVARAAKKAAAAAEEEELKKSGEWNSVGRSTAAIPVGVPMPYMKYDLPWMRYTVRSREELDSVHAQQLAQVQEEKAAAAKAKAAALVESRTQTVRNDIASGRCSLDLVEWQKLLIASSMSVAGVK